MDGTRLIHSLRRAARRTCCRPRDTTRAMASPRPVRNYLIPIDVGEASTIELNVRGVKPSEEALNKLQIWSAPPSGADARVLVRQTSSSQRVPRVHVYVLWRPASFVPLPTL